MQTAAAGTWRREITQTASRAPLRAAPTAVLGKENTILRDLGRRRRRFRPVACPGFSQERVEPVEHIVEAAPLATVAARGDARRAGGAEGATADAV